MIIDRSEFGSKVVHGVFALVAVRYLFACSLSLSLSLPGLIYYIVRDESLIIM